MAALSKTLVVVVVVVLIVVVSEFTGLRIAALSKTLVFFVGEPRLADCSIRFHDVWAITWKSETVFCCEAILEEECHEYEISFVGYSVKFSCLMERVVFCKGFGEGKRIELLWWCVLRGRIFRGFVAKISVD